ncbi:MAG: esterase family protein [Saprospiraceae bacterium]|nr:esterase family protein [Pyrinomonadaceae bacterium]
MNTHKRIFVLRILLSVLASNFAAVGQTATSQPAPVRQIVDGTAIHSVKVQNNSLNSKLMSRDMPYRVVLPRNYSAIKADGPRYSVIYLLHGLTGHFDNWTDRTALAEYASKHNFIIVTPEGDNGWYTDSVSVPNDKYESYIVKELIPEIDKTFRTVADRDHRAIAGLSMGGYGAIKFGMKYPEMFSLAGSFSGALGVATFGEGIRDAAFMKTITTIYGPAESETRKANDLFGIVRTSTSEKIKSMPFFYIDCGSEDFLFQNNRDFVTLLLEKKVPHEFRQLPGSHNWAFWNSQVKEFLEVADSRLKK